MIHMAKELVDNISTKVKEVSEHAFSKSDIVESGNNYLSEAKEWSSVYEDSRPSFRAGIKDTVWENAKDDNGLVRDPLTNEIMDKNKAWDMGHKPGEEWWKTKNYAKENNKDDAWIRDVYNDPDRYRPELPSSNRSHKGEDLSDYYLN